MQPLRGHEPSEGEYEVPFRLLAECRHIHAGRDRGGRIRRDSSADQVAAHIVADADYMVESVQGFAEGVIVYLRKGGLKAYPLAPHVVVGEHFPPVVSLQGLVVGWGPAVVVVDRVRIHGFQRLQDAFGRYVRGIVDVDESRRESDHPVAPFGLFLLGSVRQPGGQDGDIVPARCEQARGVVHPPLYSALVWVKVRVHIHESHDSRPSCLFLYADAMKLTIITANMNARVTVCAVPVPR